LEGFWDFTLSRFSSFEGRILIIDLRSVNRKAEREEYSLSGPVQKKNLAILRVDAKIIIIHY